MKIETAIAKIVASGVVVRQDKGQAWIDIYRIKYGDRGLRMIADRFRGKRFNTKTLGEFLYRIGYVIDVELPKVEDNRDDRQVYMDAIVGKMDQYFKTVNFSDLLKAPGDSSFLIEAWTRWDYLRRMK